MAAIPLSYIGENDTNSTYCEKCGCRITLGMCAHGVRPPQTLKNSRAIIEYKPNGNEAMDIFSGSDLDDKYNDTQFFAKTKRGHAKAWAALVAAWHENMTIFGACEILYKNGIRTHIYCGMD